MNSLDVLQAYVATSLDDAWQSGARLDLKLGRNTTGNQVAIVGGPFLPGAQVGQDRRRHPADEVMTLEGGQGVGEPGGVRREGARADHVEGVPGDVREREDVHRGRAAVRGEAPPGGEVWRARVASGHDVLLGERTSHAFSHVEWSS